MSMKGKSGPSCGSLDGMRITLALLGSLLLATLPIGCATTPGPAAPDLLEAIRSSTVVDLTHVLDAASPYWPGSKYFPFECWDLAKFEEGRAFSRAYRVSEHYGTRVDAPVHFAEGQAPLGAAPLARCIGPGVGFDIREKAAREPDAALTVEDVDAWEAVNGRIPEGAIALLPTGWGARWGDAEAYRNFDAGGTLRFPSYGLDA